MAALPVEDERPPGDIGPRTDAGRVIAITVMVVGIAYVAILTAAMAQQFLATIVGTEIDEEARLLDRLEAIDARLARLEETLSASVERNAP
jgi:voltage-gated potassium channel